MNRTLDTALPGARHHAERIVRGDVASAKEKVLREANAAPSRAATLVLVMVYSYSFGFVVGDGSIHRPET